MDMKNYIDGKTLWHNGLPYHYVNCRVVDEFGRDSSIVVLEYPEYTALRETDKIRHIKINGELYKAWKV